MYRERPEKVVKTKRQGKKEKQVKRLRIYMAVVAIIVCISVAAAAVIACVQIFLPSEDPSSNLSSVVSQEEEMSRELPEYEDSLNLLLVNSSQKIPEDWEVQLQKVEEIYVDQRILPALEALLKKAVEDGIVLQLSGGYVSSEEQDLLYEELVQQLLEEGYTQVRAEDKAQTSLGKGGFSENQTGLSVSFSVDGEESFRATDAYQWLMDHAANYGFTLRFPEGKEEETGRDASASCFRYVGTEHAKNMKRLSMCLEEYEEYIANQQG